MLSKGVFFPELIVFAAAVACGNSHAMLFSLSLAAVKEDFVISLEF